jgi:hypothetical protein
LRKWREERPLQPSLPMTCSAPSTTLVLSILGPLVALACADPGTLDRSGERTSSIVGGSASPASQNSTVLITNNGQSWCTGTLIAADLVLTALHCVSDVDENAQTDCPGTTREMPASGFKVSVGPTLTQQGNLAVAEIIRHPSANLCGSDMSILRLAQPIPNAKISKIRETPLKKGEAVTAVGFGMAKTGGEMQSRRQRTIKVEAVGPASFAFQRDGRESMTIKVPEGDVLTEESTCHGDSGGSLFDKNGELVGATSRGVDDSCVGGKSVYATTAHNASFIKEVLAGGGPTGSEGGSSGSSGSSGTDPNDPNGDPNQPLDPDQPFDPNDPNMPFDPNPPPGYDPCLDEPELCDPYAY